MQDGDAPYRYAAGGSSKTPLPVDPNLGSMEYDTYGSGKTEGKEMGERHAEG